MLENYRILGRAIGFTPEDTVFPMQRHTDIIRLVTEAQRGEGLFRETAQVCDGQITDRPGVALVAFSADCTPVLLFDPVRRAIGAVHAGWRGTAAGIAAKAVAAMTDAFGCRPEDIRAAIGPCIGKCCFETDADVPEAMVSALDEKARPAIEGPRRKIPRGPEGHQRPVAPGGRRRRNRHLSDCTACDPARYWSHRRVGETGGLSGGNHRTEVRCAP